MADSLMLYCIYLYLYGQKLKNIRKREGDNMSEYVITTDNNSDLPEEYPDRKIIVVDSLSASLGQGLLVWLAQQKKELGQTLEDVADWVEKNKLKMVHLFTVDLS